MFKFEVIIQVDTLHEAYDIVVIVISLPRDFKKPVNFCRGT
jgi:hypothetical protein